GWADRGRVALVARTGAPRGERVEQRRERARLAEVRLAVADADLHGREVEVRAHAPPELRVLVDRARLVEEADVALEAVPAVVGVRDATARERAREDLRTRRVEAAVHAFHERRAGAEREQLGQVIAQTVTDGDRPVGPVDRHVYVEAEAVVAPDDVLEDLVVPPVVRSVDDPLVLPRAPRVRAG